VQEAKVDDEHKRGVVPMVAFQAKVASRGGCPADGSKRGGRSKEGSGGQMKTAESFLNCRVTWYFFRVTAASGVPGEKGWGRLKRQNNLKKGLGVKKSLWGPRNDRGLEKVEGGGADGGKGGTRWGDQN